VLDHLRRNQLIATSNLRINTPIDYKRSRAKYSVGRSYSILTRVAVIDEPTQLTARLTLYDLIDMLTELGLEPPQITVLMGPAKVDDVMPTLVLKVELSLEIPTSPASFALASARSWALRYSGKTHGRQQTDCRHYNHQLHQDKSMLAEVLMLLLQSIRSNLIGRLSLDKKVRVSKSKKLNETKDTYCSNS